MENTKVLSFSRSRTHTVQHGAMKVMLLLQFLNSNHLHIYIRGDAYCMGAKPPKRIMVFYTSKRTKTLAKVMWINKLLHSYTISFTLILYILITYYFIFRILLRLERKLCNCSLIIKVPTFRCYIYSEQLGKLDFKCLELFTYVVVWCT